MVKPDELTYVSYDLEELMPGVVAMAVDDLSVVELELMTGIVLSTVASSVAVASDNS
jgi:hypothetical protein